MRRLIGNKPVSTVGELKEILNQIPDNYTLTCMGTEFAVVADNTDKFILIDEVNFIEEILQEEEDKMETVEFWKEDFKNSNRTIEEEIEEIKGSISNERLWLKGSSSKEEEEMFLKNIEELEEYLEWLENNCSDCENCKDFEEAR